MYLTMTTISKYVLTMTTISKYVLTMTTISKYMCTYNDCNHLRLWEHVAGQIPKLGIQIHVGLSNVIHPA